MKKIRILQVGHKHDHGKQTFDSLMRLDKLFDVIGIADEDVENAKRWVTNAPAFYTIEEALQLDIDAVTVECEEEKATEYALMFAERGIHVHLDKPGTQNIKSFNRLCDIIRERSLVLQMGYMYRYNPMICELIDRVRRGELGDIFSVEAQMSVRHDREKRMWLGKFKGGMMYFLGCHLVDLVLQICGDPEEIIPLSLATGADDISSEDYGFAVFKYKNGVSFVKSCASEYNGFARRQIVVTGSLGTAEIKPIEIICGDDIYTPIRTTLDVDDPPAWADGACEGRSEMFNRYDGMMTAFAEYINGTEINPYTPEYEKKLFSVLMQCCGMHNPRA